MVKITTELIRKFRQKTSAGIMDCRRALEAAGGDQKKALEWLKKKGMAKAKSKADREVRAGLVEAYTHGEGKIVAVVELACETDFVARTKEFKKLAHEIAMQVAAMKPKTVDALLKQPYIRDEKTKIGELISQAVAKLGENILVRKLARFELGEN
jgi:elongation factor Ts